MILVIFSAIFASKMKISAEKFESKKGETILLGNVKITRDTDELTAQKVVLSIDGAQKLRTFLASGGVKFKIKTKDGREIFGQSEELFFDAKASEYRMKRNARAKNLQNELRGDEIVLRQKTGEIFVNGGKSAPAELVFDLEK